jgi:hypothetical protein
VRWRIVANAFSMTFVGSDKSNKFLFACGRGADDDQRSRLLQRTRSSDQASLSRATVESDCPAFVLAEQHRQCFLELSGRDALKVEDRDQQLESLRPGRVRRQNRRREADALGTFADPLAHPRATNRDRTDAGYDLTLRQMAVAHQTSVAIVDYLVGVSFEQSRYIGFDRMPEQPRAPLRNTSVSGSPKVPGWGNCKTLVSDGDGGAESTIRYLIPSCGHQLSNIVVSLGVSSVL